MSQSEILPVNQDGFLDFTGWTLEEVLKVAPRYGPEGRSNFIFDEAVGALVVRPSSRAVVERAILARAQMLADYCKH